jgi:hypothetical protein
MWKLFEELVLKRLKPITEEKQCQRISLATEKKNHPGIDQVHRITDVTEKSF